MVVWHPSTSPLTEESCRALCHAPPHPPPWRHWDAPTHCYHPFGQTRWVHKNKGKIMIILLSKSSFLFCNCLSNCTYREGLFLFWQLLILACLDIHANTYTCTHKGREHWACCGHVPSPPVKCHVTIMQPEVSRSKTEESCRLFVCCRINFLLFPLPSLFFLLVFQSFSIYLFRPCFPISISP